MEPTKSLVESDPFSEMEKADEQMVLDEIKGRALDALVYEFRQGGQTVTGLSLAGVRETARSMNKNGQARIGISEREPVITETDAYFEVKVYAHDSMNGGGYWGIKRQAKQYDRGGANQFALEQALAKAQRNALRGLIPEWFVKEMIEAWRQKGHVRTVGTRAQTPATVKAIEQPPAPKPAPPTAEQIEQLRVDAHDGERPWVTEPRPEPTVPDLATAPTAHLPAAPSIPSKQNGDGANTKRAQAELKAHIANYHRSPTPDQLAKMRGLLAGTLMDLLGTEEARHMAVAAVQPENEKGSVNAMTPGDVGGWLEWLDLRKGDNGKYEWTDQTQTVKGLLMVVTREYLKAHGQQELTAIQPKMA